MDWEARIAELERAEREALAQFNFLAGRLEEARALYAMATQEDEPAPGLTAVEEVEP